MKKYFVLQIKRLLRVVPAVAIVLVLLLFGGSMVYDHALRTAEMKGNTVAIGVVGAEDDHLLQTALTMLSAMDSSRLEAELIPMEDAHAKEALQNGEVAAYVVFPEEFLDQALHGNILPLQFVSMSGNEGIVSLIRNELTDAVSQILLISEYGAFALGKALRDLGYADAAHTKMQEISYAFASVLFFRENLYTVQIESTQGNDQHTGLLAGLGVTVAFLLCTPFAPVVIREDLTAEKMLSANGCGAAKQIICEFGAFTLIVFAVVAIPGILFFGILRLLSILSVILLLCGISYLVYSFAKDVVGGSVVQLLLCLFMCFFGGCMIPVYFLPITVQKMADFLPTALCRVYLTEAFWGGDILVSGSCLWMLTAVCVLICILMRHNRLLERRAEAR